MCDRLRYSGRSINKNKTFKSVYIDLSTSFRGALIGLGVYTKNKIQEKNNTNAK